MLCDTNLMLNCMGLMYKYIIYICVLTICYKTQKSDALASFSFYTVFILYANCVVSMKIVMRTEEFQILLLFVYYFIFTVFWVLKFFFFAFFFHFIYLYIESLSEKYVNSHDLMALAKTKCAGGVILTKMRGEQR